MRCKARDMRRLVHHVTWRDIPRLTLRLKGRVWPGHFATHVYPLVRHDTMLPYETLYSLWNAVRSVVARDIPGCAVECGVAKGGSGALIGRALLEFDANRRMFCFDTFEGLPPPTSGDPDYERAVDWTGKCGGTVEEVDALFRRVGLTNYHLIKGKFQETLSATNTDLISVLHLDGDWYDSTKSCLDNLWDRVAEGGIVQIDDYGAWQGCQRAVDEFFGTRNIDVRLYYVNPTARRLIKYAPASGLSRGRIDSGRASPR